MMLPRVFHLITSLKVGGTERFVQSVINGLKDKYEFSVGYIKERGLVADELENAGIRIIHLPGLNAIYKHLKENKYEVMHTHLYRANIYGRIAGKLVGVPIIISSQRAIDAWKKWYHVFLDCFTSQWCKRVVANSEATKLLLSSRERISDKKVVVVHNGIDLNYYNNKNGDTVKTGITPGNKVVLCVLRLHKEKGADLLPKIFKGITAVHPDTKFVVVGDGPEVVKIKAEIKLLGIGENVVFAGEQKDVRPYYSIADILLLPSREESFPQVVLEAFAYSVPVIASDVGGVKEIVKDGVNGYTVEPGNITVLVEKTVQLLTDDKVREKMAGNALGDVKQFDIKLMWQKIDNIYSELINKVEL
ncbi:MAG: glycosyltransferase [Elusimicrobiota bacterium]